MQMTNGEIVRSFREAKKPKQQITVLADLNATDKVSIAQILYEAGELSAQTVGQYRRGRERARKVNPSVRALPCKAGNPAPSGGI